MSWYTNLKIRVKLLIGFIFLTCVSIFIGVYAIIKIDGAAESNVQMYEERAKPLGSLTYVTRDFFIMRMTLRGVRVLFTPEEINQSAKDIESAKNSIGKEMEEYAKALSSPEEKALYDEFEKQLTL
jgi:methyl-accepting chemotaxis protein